LFPSQGNGRVSARPGTGQSIPLRPPRHRHRYRHRRPPRDRRRRAPNRRGRRKDLADRPGVVVQSPGGETVDKKTRSPGHIEEDQRDGTGKEDPGSGARGADCLGPPARPWSPPGSWTAPSPGSGPVPVGPSSSWVGGSGHAWGGCDEAVGLVSVLPPPGGIFPMQIVKRNCAEDHANRGR